MTGSTPAPGASIAVAALPNLRELGGWPAAGGRVRRGLLYRSTALGKLTDADLEQVGAIGLRRVYDFRTEAERTAEPDRVPVGAEYVVVDVLADAPGAGPAQLLAVLGDPPKAAEMLSGGKAEAMFEHGYRQLVGLESALAGYNRFFSEIAQEPNRPALYHCTTGKDPDGLGICGAADAAGSVRGRRGARVPAHERAARAGAAADPRPVHGATAAMPASCCR